MHTEGIQILLPVSISCHDVTEEKAFTCPSGNKPTASKAILSSAGIQQSFHRTGPDPHLAFAPEVSRPIALAFAWN